MSQLSDIEVLKDIPGYKAIMKSVLKSQIQLLLEQLSDNTGEESIILTASVHDGTLSHLGSSTGKGFLEGRDEIKSQFLGYCLKTHHKQKTQETKTPYQRSHPGPRTPTQHQPPMKRPRPSPVSLSRVSPGRPPPRPQPKPPSYSYNTHPGTGGMPLSSDDQNISESHADGDVIVKQEISDNQDNINHQSAHTDTSIGIPANTSATPISFPSSLQLSHTQTSSDQANAEQTEGAHEQTDNVNLDSSSIKIEPITEGEMDLEITGVEVADNSMSSEAWGQQGQIGYGMDGDGSFSHGDGDPSGYSSSSSAVRGHYATGDERAYLHTKTSLQDKNAGFIVAGAVNQYYTGSISDAQFSKHDVQERQQIHQQKKFSFNPDIDQQKNFSCNPEVSVYACNVCGKIFKVPSHVQRHMTVHTGERKFVCILCKRDFRLKHHLKEHLKNVHNLDSDGVEKYVYAGDTIGDSVLLNDTK